MCVVFAYEDTPKEVRWRKIVFQAVAAGISYMAGFSIVGVLILLFSLMFLFKFMKFELHDMFSFGNSVQGWTNKGNFHIINTVTGLDEDGNRWVVK